jgi:glutathione S-transferase
MRILYQFPLSHFCEKARWLLDHKELDYVAHNLMPGVHRAFAQLKTGQNKLPILKDKTMWIADSTHIALYLDDLYPEHRLLNRQLKLREEAIEIDMLAAELGQHVRRWGLNHVLVSDESMDILIGEKGYLRRFEKYSKPLLKSLLSKGYKLETDQVDISKARMDEIIQQLNKTLIANGGRYLVGDALGLADISVCSMLAPLLEIKETPWEKESETPLAVEFYQYKHYLLNLPLGQYVQRIYQNERHARVDWRGV